MLFNNHYYFFKFQYYKIWLILHIPLIHTFIGTIQTSRLPAFLFPSFFWLSGILSVYTLHEKYICCLPPTELYILSWTHSLTQLHHYKYSSALLQICASVFSAASFFSALTEIYILSFGSVPEGRTTIEQLSSRRNLRTSDFGRSSRPRL